ncbi:MAG TPA: hypothetical protein VFX96_11500 [Pyrinomonadaceae bacterium]|nr:hypothetical protein [Pyrinomonadaceae bacterium]
MNRFPRPAHGILAFGLALFVSALAACAGEEEAEPLEPPLVVTAAQLLSAYAADEFSADDLYRGRVLAVSGHIAGVGRDPDDAAFVTLDPGEPAGGMGVQCLFDRRRAGSVASLKKGQRVTLVGRCDGKFGNIVLRECALPAPAEGPPARLDTR